MPVKIKRIYEPPAADDGQRILVDRLWPRGVSKDRARLDRWCKEIAPSDALRHWFHAGPQDWDEFERRYRAELAAQPGMLRELVALTATDVVTLLFGSKDEERNNAAVLAEVLREEIVRGRRAG